MVDHAECSGQSFLHAAGSGKRKGLTEVCDGTVPFSLVIACHAELSAAGWDHKRLPVCTRTIFGKVPGQCLDMFST